jgi:hypothetical protein
VIASVPHVATPRRRQRSRRAGCALHWGCRAHAGQEV